VIPRHAHRVVQDGRWRLPVSVGGAMPLRLRAKVGAWAS